MNLKKLGLILLIGALSFQTFAANSIEIGFEHEQYDSTYNDSDLIAPYTKLNLNPIKDSNLQLEFKYMYFHQYGNTRNEGHNNRFKSRKDRYEFFASGYKYKNGNFTFSPKIGFRYEISDINREKNSSQDERMFNLRFYPNFTYNINNDIQLYLNGHTGPMINRVQQGTRLKNDGTSATYWHDWYQEMEILGVKYKIDSNNSIWTSIFNEYKNREHKDEFTRWQWRIGYNWNATSDLSINPFIRYDLSYKTTDKKETSKIKNINENNIIQEIILNHYLKNKKQTRKDILKSYLSNYNTKNMFKNKNAIEQAIKNINEEMEDAQKEFSKLFEQDYQK